jgi:dihydroorotate dehydrogenase
MLGQGFSFVEIGSVTLATARQKPRMFAGEDEGVINRPASTAPAWR